MDCIRNHGLRNSAYRRPMESGFIPVDSSQIYYESHGIGSAILFLHAGVADSRMWRGQRHLDGYHSVMFDQRGFGQTKWEPGPYSNRGDAVSVLDHLGIDTAVVVGCSNGGEAAMQLAIVAPDRVTGLVLVGASPRGWEPDGGWLDDPIWDEAVAVAKSGNVEAIVEMDARLWLAGNGRSLGEIDGEHLELFLEMDRIPAITEAERDEHVVTLEPPTNEQLDSIKSPTLVVVGEYDHPDLHLAADYLAERLSDHDAVVIPDAAHLPSLEQPEVFNTELKAFLAHL